MQQIEKTLTKPYKCQLRKGQENKTTYNKRNSRESYSNEVTKVHKIKISPKKGYTK